MATHPRWQGACNRIETGSVFISLAIDEYNWNGFYLCR
jgi:hypothetical protein